MRMTPYKHTGDDDSTSPDDDVDNYVHHDDITANPDDIHNDDANDDRTDDVNDDADVAIPLLEHDICDDGDDDDDVAGVLAKEKKRTESIGMRRPGWRPG